MGTRLGPLFAFGFLAILALTSAVSVFLVAKMFLKFWPAVWLALAATAAGWTALVLMLFAQAPFYPSTLVSNQPLAYLGTAAVTGLLAAVLAGWLTVRTSRRQ